MVVKTVSWQSEYPLLDIMYVPGGTKLLYKHRGYLWPEISVYKLCSILEN